MNVGFVRRLIPAFTLAAIVAATGSSSAVVGGRPADPGEYPWMALTFRAHSTDGIPLLRGPVCGGALIAPRFVISAHHCILDLIDPTLARLPADPAGLGLNVLLGTNRRSDTGGERIRVKAFHKAPDPPLGLIILGETDVMILELYEESQQPTLPWADADDVGLYPPGTLATIIGWGLMEEAPLSIAGVILAGLRGEQPDELQEAEVPIIDDAECAPAYAGDFVAETQVCAGYPEGGVDTCQGDSGGPLLVRDELQNWVLIGTTWYGNGCARPGYPGVYTEVAAVSDFIASVVG